MRMPFRRKKKSLPHRVMKTADRVLQAMAAAAGMARFAMRKRALRRRRRIVQEAPGS